MVFLMIRLGLIQNYCITYYFISCVSADNRNGGGRDLSLHFVLIKTYVLMYIKKIMNYYIIILIAYHKTYEYKLQFH